MITHPGGPFGPIPKGAGCVGVWVCRCVVQSRVGVSVCGYFGLFLCFSPSNFPQFARVSIAIFENHAILSEMRLWPPKGKGRDESSGCNRCFRRFRGLAGEVHVLYLLGALVGGDDQVAPIDRGHQIGFDPMAVCLPWGQANCRLRGNNCAAIRPGAGDGLPDRRRGGG